MICESGKSDEKLKVMLTLQKASLSSKQFDKTFFIFTYSQINLVKDSFCRHPVSYLN